jgi:hypothetical protein
MSEHDPVAAYNADWARLCDAARGRDAVEVESLIRQWASGRAPYLEEVDVQSLARVMSDAGWARKHPLSAFALAWKHRHSRPVHRSLRMLWRPRFVG